MAVPLMKNRTNFGDFANPRMDLNTAREIALGGSGVYGEACRRIVEALYAAEHSLEVIENRLSDALTDAKRFQTIIDISRHELDELSPQAKNVWKRLIKGGWYTDDLIQMIDNLNKTNENTK